MNNKNNSAATLAAVGLGFVFSYAVFAIFTSDSEDALVFPSGMLTLVAVAGVCYLAVILIKLFLVPYLARRRAALRALGKDGVQILRNDPTARLVYKGIYAIMCNKFPEAENLLMQALSRADVRQNQMFCVEWLIKLYETAEADSKLMWCYRKAVEISPDNPEAQSRLGHAYFSDGKLDKALYCFEQALRYDPNNGYAYFSIAKIQLVRGEDEKAFETLQNLVKINENHPLCHAELADYYAMKGDREKAEEECKKAQLCGLKEPEEFNRRINAMLSFHDTEYDGKDLPSMYYRRILPSGWDEKNDGKQEGDNNA